MRKGQKWRERRKEEEGEREGKKVYILIWQQCSYCTSAYMYMLLELLSVLVRVCNQGF